jgi:hypothetical protein
MFSISGMVFCVAGRGEARWAARQTRLNLLQILGFPAVRACQTSACLLLVALRQRAQAALSDTHPAMPALR